MRDLYGPALLFASLMCVCRLVQELDAIQSQAQLDRAWTLVVGSGTKYSTISTSAPNDVNDANETTVEVCVADASNEGIVESYTTTQVKEDLFDDSVLALRDSCTPEADAAGMVLDTPVSAQKMDTIEEEIDSSRAQLYHDATRGRYASREGRFQPPPRPEQLL